MFKEDHLSFRQRKYMKVKNIIGRALGGIGLVVLSPVYLAIIVAIKKEDGITAPVFFSQKRVGIHKEYFNLYKFRSMRTDTPHDKPTHLLENPDQYITKVGRFLRKSSLDELPQLWNIARGDMAVIGPRPALWNQDDLIAERDKYGANDVKPGLTGWAQINGRDELEIPVKARLDGEYVKKMGPLMDIRCFIGTVSSNAISWLPTIVIAIYNFIATFLVILHYNAVMAILALASAPFMLLMSRFMIKKQREYSQKTREMSSKLMTFEVEAFYNFDTIKSFGIAPHYSRLMRWWQGKFKDVSLEYNMFSIKTNILLSVMGTGVEFIAFGYCLFLLWTHTITYGTMTLFLQQRSNLSGAFNNVVSIIPSFLNSSVSAHRIRELVELPKEVHISESEELDPFAEDGFEVLMKDVNFAYVEGTRVITDSYFKACPGEIVALVGPSGEGKTTMIRLILGLIRPQEGEAVIVASNGREIVLNAETRHFFAYVPQGNTILSGTIAENMRMVKEDATDEEIIEALKIACAWEFVEKLPDTINSALGERGRGLSEGQAQRISIARAVLRNAPILLLDEATSALDVTTERKVLRNIIEQKPNKTCIVTTHRPSVLNMCQRVYRVMETKVTELDEEESSRMAIDF